MVEISQVLGDKSLVVIFTYAPAGLGHLRVTDALYHGLPSGVVPVLLGSDDKSISFIHRITSVHPMLRGLMEMTQKGILEDVFTYLYRNYLKSMSENIYNKIISILDQRIELPKTILAVSTHFGLAHQLVEVKEKLKREKNINIYTIVQVTDDSPQHMWYVSGADIIFVPSKETKVGLMEYGGSFGENKTCIEVVAYPLSPKLGRFLLDKEFNTRQKTLMPYSKLTINIAVPVSGAAVGTDYLERLIDILSNKSYKYIFQVVSKSRSYTRPFLERIKDKNNVRLSACATDRDTVDEYERIYLNNLISLEITKPSEQAFKALFNPRQRGGVILLFSKPVGRQEYDNLNFLRRYNLIPSLQETEYIWRLANNSAEMNNIAIDDLNQKAGNWRALELSDDPRESSNIISFLQDKGIFNSMINYSPEEKFKRDVRDELKTDGVKIFWEKVAQFIVSN